MKSELKEISPTQREIHIEIDASEIKGAPSVYEYTAGGALIFNY